MMKTNNSLTSSAIIFASLAFVIFLFNPFRDNDQKVIHKKLSKIQRMIYSAQREYEMTRDPASGKIPDNIREREVKFVADLPQKAHFSALEKLGSSNYITTQDWISRGPRNQSGRMKCLAFDVDNNNVLFAGAASGGLWRSIDAGQSWVKVTPPAFNQTIYCIEQDKRPGKTNNWYYGSGELLSTTDRKVSLNARTIGFGDGIYKSSDMGITWAKLKSTGNNSPSMLSSAFQMIWDIAIDNNTSDKEVIYAACYGAIMKSTDGGETWTIAIGDLENPSFSTDVEITTDGTIYAALSSYSITGKKPKYTGVWVSNNGIDWVNQTPSAYPSSLFKDDIRVVKLAVAASNEKIVYLFSETFYYKNSAYSLAFTLSKHSLWKGTYDKTNGKFDWVERTKNIPGGYSSLSGSNAYSSLGGYCFVIKVKPDNENYVIIGGTNLFRSSNGFSDTLGTKQLGGYPYLPDSPDELHPDMHDIIFYPGDPNKMLVANDGGIHETAKLTTQPVIWKSLNSGLVTSQFYAIDIDRTGTDDFIFGGLQDNSCFATYSANAEAPWEVHIGGDGMDCSVANDKPYLVASIYNGSIFTINFKNGKLNQEYYQTPSFLEDFNKFNFYTKFVLDPNDSKTLYLPGKNIIYRKADMLASSKSQSLRDVGWDSLTKAKLDPGVSITSIDLSAKPANRLYYGTNNGTVYRIDDVDKPNYSVTDITDIQFPEGGYAACIDVDQEDADKVFVVFSNYNIQSIFYSSNGGDTWVPQGGNLEDNPDGSGAGPSVRWIESLHYGNKTIYFAGTTAGLFSTTTLAGTSTIWEQEAPESIGYLTVDKIVARPTDGTVVVATQGGGVYSTKVVTGVEEKLPYQFSNELYQNYPNPAHDNTTIGFSLSEPSNVSILLYDASGHMIRKVADEYYQPGNYSITADLGDLGNGTYFYIMKTGDFVKTRKLIVKR